MNGWQLNATLGLTLIGCPAAVVAGTWLARPVSAALLVTLSFLVLLFVSGWSATGLFRGVFIDDRNRVSLSRLQIVAWSTLILPVLLAGLVHNMRIEGDENPQPEPSPRSGNERSAANAGSNDSTRHLGPLEVEIPGSVLALMGISMTAMAASPLIRRTKRVATQSSASTAGAAPVDPGNEPEGAVRIRRGSGRATRGTELVNRSPRSSGWADIVLGEETGNGTNVDLGKLQNLYITVLLLLAYGTQLYADLRGIGETGARFDGLPPLSEGLVFLLGISHAGYLTFKAIPHGGWTTTQTFDSGRGSEASHSAMPTVARRIQGAIEHAGTEPTP